MEEKIYSALEIAKYIIAVAHENGDLITNLKLQKLLYYAQAHYMVNHNGKKLFSDDIEAWEYGPVIREVYNKYKKFSRNPIDEKSCQEDISRLTAEDQKFMDDFLIEFMDYSAVSLVNKIHNEAPWKEAFDERCPQASKIISTDSMYSYYSKL